MYFVILQIYKTRNINVNEFEIYIYVYNIYYVL